MNRNKITACMLHPFHSNDLLLALFIKVPEMCCSVYYFTMKLQISAKSFTNLPKTLKMTFTGNRFSHQIKSYH